MADTFPTIQQPKSRTKTYKKAQIRTEFEDGSVQSRAKYTKGRFHFVFNWDALSFSSYNLLYEHFSNNAGSNFVVPASFLFASNESGAPYYEDKTVIYASDELQAESCDIPGYFSLSLELEEI